MQRAPLELREGLKEDGQERVYILSRILRGLYRLPVISVREANANRLIDEEDIRF